MKKLFTLITSLLVITEAFATNIVEEELFAYRDTLRIYGKMFRPEGQKQLPVVICSHSSSLTHKAMQGYARKLAQEGYAAYCFDFCGGSSESMSDGSTDSMTVFTEVNDLHAVVDMVKRLDYSDPARIVLLGSSQGGLVSALLAEELQGEVASMVLFYPAFNIPEMVRMFSGFGNNGGGSWGNMGGMMSMSEKYINTIKDYDVWSNIGTFKNPICIVHGTSDIIVPISNSEKAITLYPNAELHRIEGANHGFNADNLGGMGSMMGGQTDYDSQVMPIVLDFLNENISLGINHSHTYNTTQTVTTYNIKGIKIESPTKGDIFIRNGKKYIARNTMNDN